MAKRLTYDQVAERKRKAEQFLRDVKGDDQRADEVSDESVEHYADRRHFDIIDNSKRRLNSMANGSQIKQDLLDQIDELEQDNQDLQDQLDAIADIVSPPDDDTDDSDEDDSDLA